MQHPGGPVGIIVCVAWLAGCSEPAPSTAGPPPPSTGGAPAPSGGRSGGTGATGGTSGTGGMTGSVTGGGGGGMPVAPSADSGATAGTGGGPAPDAATAPVADAAGSLPDASSTPTADAGAWMEAGPTPMTIAGSPPPSYAGEIPIHYGPPVPPLVEMQCPGDPTEGWTEYADSFHLEYPYRVAANTRFSITGGIYNFTVFPNDSPHSPIAMGRNPRTEATYGGLRDKATVGTRTGVYAKVAYFTTGQRLYSTDMLVEPNAYGSAIVQIHTTSAGGGPIGLRLTGGNLTNNGSMIINGSTVPGGLQNKWFNFKAAFNTADRQVRIWINNCLKATYTGARGDGRYYFKNGVYFCDDGGGCRTHFKNVHFYEKP